MQKRKYFWVLLLVTSLTLVTKLNFVMNIFAKLNFAFNFIPKKILGTRYINKPQNSSFKFLLKPLLFSFLVLIIVSCNAPQKKSESPRYIITSPEVAEIIVLIQGTDNIVGITIECDYPPELNKITKVGNFGKVDFEKVIELKPTIVFISGLEQKHLAAELNKLNIKTELIYPKSVAEMIYSIRKIGKLIDKEKRANFIADSLQTQINQLTNSTSSTNSTDSTNSTIAKVNVKESLREKPSVKSLTRFVRSFPGSTHLPKVYIEIYGNPVMSVSDSSFVGELIKIAGGDNIFCKLPRDYSRVNPEDIINANPDIILLTYPGVTALQVKNRKGWEVISAVKKDRIYTTDDVDPDLILRASPRIIEGIKQLQKVFYESN
ncbi:MAG: ABC transporter substrate-binding protein [Candidatus Cloacimonetes bacterium]|nr:ABC transporter substrate-binding protein [Candidatus Cloacimonadota bacterium]